MAIHPRMVMMILAFMYQCPCTQGFSIQNCGDDRERVAELNLDDRNLNKTFTCVGIRSEAHVQWKLTKPGGIVQSAGFCPPFDGTVRNCNTSSSYLSGYVFPKRTSRSESTMTIRVQSIQRVLENATLVCQDGRETRCPLDLIRPASGTCKAELKSSREWSVHVRCDITQGVSTMGRYRCLLSQESPRRREVEDIPMTNNQLPNGPAVCDHEFQVDFSETGSHRYSVQLTPGRARVTVLGDITIERPEEASIIQCQPEGMVPENQTLTCQCQTSSLGKPPGVLKWSRNKYYEPSGFVVLKEGEQGQSNLPYSATLTRHNHTTRLRCGVRWWKEFIKSSQGVKQVTIGYPASQVGLNINSGNPTVAEKSDATFKCWATDGRPLPTLTLTGRRLGAEQKTSQAKNLTYSWRDVRCEDSGNYTCTASNDMGPDKTATSWLNVTCGPRDFSGQIPPFLYQGEEIQFTFDLVANPTPFKVTFLFLGSLGTNSTSKVKDIVLSGSCEKKGETLVHASCTITLSNVTSSEAAGLYRGSVTNGQGSLDFNFEVKLYGASNQTTFGHVTPHTASSPVDFGVGTAVGVTLVVVIDLVIVLVIVVLLWRRHWILPCAADGHGQRNRDSRKERGEGAQSASSTAGIYELVEDDLPQQATDKPPSVDASVQTSDLGVRSVNSPLNLYQNVGAEDNQPPSVYTSLQTSDIGVRSVYSPLTPYQSLGADLHQDPVYEN